LESTKRNAGGLVGSRSTRIWISRGHSTFFSRHTRANLRQCTQQK
jgi:hypothetical protein